MYLLHFLSVPSSHGAESCSDGEKSDDNDDTCSHSGLSEEEEEGKRLEEISEVRKKRRLPSARSILEHVCVNAGEKIKSEYGFLNGWKGTS